MALAKSLRNACEKVVYNKFQVYSLQMLQMHKILSAF